MAILEGYRMKYAHDNKKCCVHVFNQWIQNNGSQNYPLTWEGLHDLLLDIEHATAAEDLKSALASI